MNHYNYNYYNFYKYAIDFLLHSMANKLTSGCHFDFGSMNNFDNHMNLSRSLYNTAHLPTNKVKKTLAYMNRHRGIYLTGMTDSYCWCKKDKKGQSRNS